MTEPLSFELSRPAVDPPSDRNDVRLDRPRGLQEIIGSDGARS